MSKPVIATASLAGCFGCHMSILDIDDRILKLIELVEFNKSPIDDIKTFTKPCDIGIIEGGCCNSENVENLRAFRKNCKILISLRRVRHHGRPAGPAQRHPPQGMPRGGLPQQPDGGPGGPAHPERRGAARHPGQGLPLPRDRQDRLLPAGVPAVGRPHLGGPDGPPRGKADRPRRTKSSNSIEGQRSWQERSR